MQIPTNWPEFTDMLVRNTDRLQSIAIIIIVTWIVQAFIVRWILAKAKDERQRSSIVIYLIRWAIVLIGVVFIFNELNQPITPILTALGVGGLAVALGLQDTLANLFAGLNILASNKIAIGDTIELPSKKAGSVTDITWRHTVLYDAKEEATIIVPNSYVVKEVITNFGQVKKTKKG